MTIDGAEGAGGGHILRTALTLAALTGTPVEIPGIRARRRHAGLQAGDLAVAAALAEMCGGGLEGAHLGSPRLTFRPDRVQAGAYRFDLHPAAAPTLLLQAVLPVLAVAPGPSEVCVTGGTEVPGNPLADHFAEVLLPLLGALGAPASLEAPGSGWHPAAGGEVRLRITGGGPLRPITRLRGADPLRIRGISVATDAGRGIAERQRQRVLERLGRAGYAAAVETATSPDPGSFLFLVAEDGADPLGGFGALGRDGRSAEQVADEAVDGVLAFAASDAGCDPWLAVQLILPLALAPGTSRFTTSRITRGLRSSLRLVGQFVGCPIHLAGEEGEPGSLTLEGVAMPGVGSRGPEARGQGSEVGGRGSRTGAGRSSGARSVGAGMESKESAASSSPTPDPRPPAPASDPQSPARASGPGSLIPALGPATPAFTVRKARAGDVPGMQALLAQFARRGDVLPRTLNEMYQHLRDFFVCEGGGEVVGMVGLYLYWEDLAEVRSLAVQEALAGRGLGRALVGACLAEARDLGIRRVFALTNRAGFFERLGFRTLDKRELPQKIWKDCIRCAKFAACDEVALIRDAEEVTRTT